MQTYLVEWSTLMGVFAIAAITPGADFALVVRQSVVYGRANAIATSFGIGLALLFHVSYTILGLGLIIAKSLIVFSIVKWLGVGYLFYIGIKSFSPHATTVQKTESGKTIGIDQSKKKLLRPDLLSIFSIQKRFSFFFLFFRRLFHHLRQWRSSFAMVYLYHRY